MHSDESQMYYGIGTSVVYVCLWAGFGVVWAFLHKMIVSEKKRDRRAMRGGGGGGRSSH